MLSTPDLSVDGITHRALPTRESSLMLLVVRFLLKLCYLAWLTDFCPHDWTRSPALILPGELTDIRLRGFILNHLVCINYQVWLEGPKMNNTPITGTSWRCGPELWIRPNSFPHSDHLSLIDILLNAWGWYKQWQLFIEIVNLYLVIFPEILNMILNMNRG